MRRRVGPVLAAAVALASLALVAARAPAPDLSVAVVGRSGAPGPAAPSSTTVPPPTAPTSTMARPTPTVVANRSSTVVRADAGWATVVNEGSAVASTGGNTVIGPPDASVVTGPVSAVGNASDVRVVSRR